MPRRAIADTAAEFIAPIRTCMTRAVGGRSLMFPSREPILFVVSAERPASVSRLAEAVGQRVSSPIFKVGLQQGFTTGGMGFKGEFA